jgi:hypothetical protein
MSRTTRSLSPAALPPPRRLLTLLTALVAAGATTAAAQAPAAPADAWTRLPQARAAIIFADLTPEITAPPGFGPVTHMSAWDAFRRSIVVDLGRVYRVREARLTATRSPRPPHTDGVALYASVDNRRYWKVEASFEVRPGAAPGEVWVGVFAGVDVLARYLKFHNPYEGSDSGFTATDAANMPAVFADAPDTAFPQFDHLEMPLWASRGEVPISLTVTNRGADTSARILVRHAHSGYAAEFQFPLPADTHRLAVPLQGAPAGDLAVEVLLCTGAARQTADRTERVLTLFDRLHDMPPPGATGALPEGEAVFLHDLRQATEAVPGHRTDRGYQSAWGRDGTMVQPLDIRANGFVVWWPWEGTFAVSALVTPDVERVSLQAGTGAPEEWRLREAEKVSQPPATLTAMFLGTFTNPAGVRRLRIALPPSQGSLGAIMVRPCPTAFPPSATPPQGTRRVLINNDGFSVFYMKSMLDAAEMARYTGLYANTDVQAVTWCVGNPLRLNYNSRVVPPDLECRGPYPREGERHVAEAVRNYIQAGEDTLDAQIRICAQWGLSCQASLRMAMSAPNAEYEQVAEAFYREHLPWRQVRRDGSPLPLLSYAYPGVRAHVLAILQEMAERRPDALVLELVSGAPFVGYEPELVEAFRREAGAAAGAEIPETDPRWLRIKSGPLTDLMRQLRAATRARLSRAGKPIQIGAYVDNMGFRTEGVDLETWVREGLVDFLIAGIGQASDAIGPVLQAADGRVPVYGHIHAHFGGKDPTPEDERRQAKGLPVLRTGSVMTQDYFRESAYRLYSQGAAGVSIWDGWMYPAIIGQLGDREALSRWHWLEQPTQAYREPITPAP